MPARAAAQKAATQAKASAPAIAEAPIIQIDSDLEDAAEEAENHDVTTTEAEASEQKIIKLNAFIAGLKADYPTAKRFNIYLFSDRAQTITNKWSDSEPVIYIQPALISISLPDSKPKLLNRESFNAKFNTKDWAIQFSQSKTRRIDTSEIVNILKVLPEEKKYKEFTYYESQIRKPDASEQRIAARIAEAHDLFPVFKKAFKPRTETETADERDGGLGPEIVF